MKDKVLGTWDLGIHSVKLIVSPTGYDGHFKLFPKEKIPEISIGLMQRHWPHTLEVLLHEALELSFVQIGRRYNPAPDYGNSSASFIFVANHEEFTEAVSRAGQFVAQTSPALEKAWKSNAKQRKAK